MSITRAMHPPRSDNTRPRVPVPAAMLLALLLLLGPVLMLAASDEAKPAQPLTTLADIARGAGCTLTAFENDSARSNPPVTGRYLENMWPRDGSYAGKRPPSPIGTLHALLHGRVLFQYRPGLDRDELRALDRLTRRDPKFVLLFENQTGMRPRIAATAYLNLMTCPRVDQATLKALAAFRDRRRAFGQDF